MELSPGIAPTYFPEKCFTFRAKSLKIIKWKFPLLTYLEIKQSVQTREFEKKKKTDQSCKFWNVSFPNFKKFFIHLKNVFLPILKHVLGVLALSFWTRIRWPAESGMTQLPLLMLTSLKQGELTQTVWTLDGILASILPRYSLLLGS